MILSLKNNSKQFIQVVFVIAFVLTFFIPHNVAHAEVVTSPTPLIINDSCGGTWTGALNKTNFNPGEKYIRVTDASTFSVTVASAPAGGSGGPVCN